MTDVKQNQTNQSLGINQQLIMEIQPKAAKKKLNEFEALLQTVKKESCCASDCKSSCKIEAMKEAYTQYQERRSRLNKEIGYYLNTNPNKEHLAYLVPNKTFILRLKKL